jgi:hypothetical protein
MTVMSACNSMSVRARASQQPLVRAMRRQPAAGSVAQSRSTQQGNLHAANGCGTGLPAARPRGGVARCALLLACNLRPASCAMSDDDDWETDPDYVNDVTEARPHLAPLAACSVLECPSQPRPHLDTSTLRSRRDMPQPEQ